MTAEEYKLIAALQVEMNEQFRELRGMVERSHLREEASHGMIYDKIEKVDQRLDKRIRWLERIGTVAVALWALVLAFGPDAFGLLAR